MESMVIEDRGKPIVIVDVWAENLDFEFSRIASAAPIFPFLSIDTEFPGVVVRPPVVDATAGTSQRSSHIYKGIKANVDSLKLIQLGITLADCYGNLPDFGGNCCFVWQFNFKEFDVSHDPHVADSIELLRQGIDFEKNKKEGIDSTRFSELMFYSGLIFYNTGLLSWVTFHGGYDFAYLLKILTRQPLPDDIWGFYKLINHYFGFRIYDLKHIIKYFDGVYGGLEQVAKTFGLQRIAGNAHCAGSDSLLTWGVFQKILLNKECMQRVGVLYGLDIHTMPTPLMSCMTQVPPVHPCYRVLPSLHPWRPMGC